MSLIDYLAEKTHCEYVSDLHWSQANHSDVQRFLKGISLSDFSEREWIDAAEYLYDVRCKNAEEAKSFLSSPGLVLHKPKNPEISQIHIPKIDRKNRA